MKKRDQLIDDLVRGLEANLCLCKKIQPRGSWPHSGGYMNVPEEEATSIMTDDRGRKTYHRPKLLHLQGCPAGAKTVTPIVDIVRPYMERITDLKLRIDDLEAKLVGEAKADSHHVGFDGYYLKAAEMYHDEISADEYEALLADIATAISGKVLIGRGWQHNDEVWQNSEPIVETHHGKEGNQSWETPAVLGTRSDGSTNAYAVFPSAERAKAFLRIGRQLHKIIQGTYKAGKRRGASLLETLAKDHLTLRAFQEQVEGKEEK